MSIEPVSAVPHHLVKDHLLRRGLRPEIIEWKYFDATFGRGRERGYAWLRDGRVQGMVGIIPFRMAGLQRSYEAAWTCDWHVETPDKNPGIGMLLLKTAIAETDLLVTLGGNDATRRLVPRLATRTVPEGGFELILPLRFGGTRLYQRIASRAGWRSLRAIEAIPIRAANSSRRGIRGVRTEHGVSPVIHAVIERSGRSALVPMYDHQYLQWQLARCPAVDAGSCYAPEVGAPDAAALFWRQTGDGRLWRLALWLAEGAYAQGQAVLAEVLRQVARQKGHSVSAVVSCIDGPVTQVIRGAGFRSTGRILPFYVLGKDRSVAVPGPSTVSYLDTDLAYRF